MATKKADQMPGGSVPLDTEASFTPADAQGGDPVEEGATEANGEATEQTDEGEALSILSDVVAILKAVGDGKDQMDDGRITRRAARSAWAKLVDGGAS